MIVLLCIINKFSAVEANNTTGFKPYIPQKLVKNDFGQQIKILTFPPSTFPKVIRTVILGPRMNSKYAFSARHCLSVSRLPQPYQARERNNYGCLLFEFYLGQVVEFTF